MMRNIVNEYIPFWNGLITHYVDSVRGWRVWYAIVFSILWAVDNILPALFPYLNNPHTLQGHLYIFFDTLVLLLQISSAPILLLPLTRALRGGKKYLLLSTNRDDPSKIKKIYHQCVLALLMGLFLPVIFTMLNMLPSFFMYFVLPHFARSQHLFYGHGLVVSVVMGLVASLEELWRWSSIFAILLVAKNLSKFKWANMTSYRRWAFVLALIISSLLFGMGHMAEFSRYQFLSIVILGGSGLILALVAILTRRLWMAITVHALYDFLVNSKFINGYAIPYFLLLFLIGVVFVISLFWISYHKIRSHSVNQVLHT